MKHHYTKHDPTGPLPGVSCSDCTTGPVAPQYACPKCKSTKLRVLVKSMATLVQEADGSCRIETDDGPFSNYDWDEDSRVDCEGCGNSGRLYRFIKRVTA